MIVRRLEKPQDASDEKRMPFLEHLAELRTCLRNAAIALVITTGIAYAFRQYLFALMARPLIDAWVEAQKEVGIGKPEMVFTSLVAELRYVPPIKPLLVTASWTKIVTSVWFGSVSAKTPSGSHSSSVTVVVDSAC